MASIPMEVVESCILPRLPVKSLVRFKSVSKSWKTLISSSNFLHIQHRHAKRLLLIQGDGHTLLQVHNLDSLLDPPSLCPYPDPYYNKQLPRRPQDKMTIFASCEFFVLVSHSNSITVERLFLLNPSTLSYHRIIPSDVEQVSVCSDVIYGLYFDEANDDCKVVRIAKVYWGDEHGWEFKIYSCKTNLWRLIEHKLTLDPYHGINFRSLECVHNNLLYVITDSSMISIHLRIRCFDIQAEQWTNDILFPHNLIFPEVCIFDGLLCILGTNASNEEEVRTMTYCMWVLNESTGAKESWVKLMSIVPECFWESRFRPLAYRKGSQHELLCRRSHDSELFWYDLKHKIASRAEFNDGARCNNIDHICKESLVSFSRWPNRSY